MLLCEFVGQMSAAIREKTKYTFLQLCWDQGLSGLDLVRRSAVNSFTRLLAFNSKTQLDPIKLTDKQRKNNNQVPSVAPVQAGWNWKCLTVIKQWPPALAFNECDQEESMSQIFMYRCTLRCPPPEDVWGGAERRTLMCPMLPPSYQAFIPMSKFSVICLVL